MRRKFGGDGIGNIAADCKHYFEIRHFRDGTVRAHVRGHYWHQNGATDDAFARCDEVLGCETVEDVVCRLKGVSVEGVHAYSDQFEEKLTAALVDLGLEESLPAPDEVVA